MIALEASIASKNKRMDRIKTSIGKQFKKQNLQFCDAIEIKYDSDFIVDI
jgi:hypothetical protein